MATCIMCKEGYMTLIIIVISLVMIIIALIVSGIGELLYAILRLVIYIKVLKVDEKRLLVKLALKRCRRIEKMDKFNNCELSLFERLTINMNYTSRNYIAVCNMYFLQKYNLKVCSEIRSDKLYIFLQ